MSGPILCASALLFCSILASAQLTAQSRISADVSRQIDSALYILGMHQRDLAMPHDLLDRDKHRTSTIDDLFRTPYSAVDLSERIADKCLSGSSSLLPLQEVLHSALQLGTFQRVFLDNMPESETVLSKLSISKGSISKLNIASSILLLRHAGILIQATDAVKPGSKSQSAENLLVVSALDSLWRISRESESNSVWDAYKDETASFNKAQSLYNSIHVSSAKNILALGPSLHDDLLRISNELLNARDVLIDSIKTIIFETPYGRIAIGGPGNDVYQGRFAMIIDVGGDDVYKLSSEPLASHLSSPVRFIVDLDGNDAYYGDDYSLAAGIHGVGILIDRAGNDVYTAGSYSLGSGLMGIGILHDLQGDDSYTGGTNSQGAGILGIGLLLDDAGNDQYRCQAQSQAFAGVGGIGVLGDRNGNDIYIASSPYMDVLRYDNHQITFAQGAALGSRPHASGGIAVLADGAGSDTYICDIYGQGTGYWFGLGSLIDRGGDDKYIAHQYAQGSGVHFATGYLHDVNGDDTYVSHGVSQGCGHDIAYGFFIDEGGDDDYTCESLSLGSGNANAVSIFVDLRGDDGYLAKDTTNTIGFSDYRRGYGMISLFIDAQGNDRYTTQHDNSTSRVKSTYGAFIDYTDTTLQAAQQNKPAPYTSQVELPTAIDSLFILASASHLRFQHSVEPARKRLGSLGTAVLPLLEKNLGTQMPRQRITVETAAKLVYAEHPDSTIAMLQRGLRSVNNTAVGTAATIASTVKARAVSPVLLELADDQDWRKRRLAAFTLGELRDTTSIARAKGLLNDSLAYVRARAAFAVGATDSLPFAALASPLSDSFQVVRYSAVEGINRGRKRTVSEVTGYLASVGDDRYFCSNARLLLNADTTKSDVKLWKSWVKGLSPNRLQALRRIQRILPAPLQPALVPTKQKVKKPKRATP